jgi:hypothetical protein
MTPQIKSLENVVYIKEVPCLTSICAGTWLIVIGMVVIIGRPIE